MDASKFLGKFADAAADRLLAGVDRKLGDSKMSLRIAFEAMWIVWWMRIADRLGWL